MPIKLEYLNNKAIQAGASLNIADLQIICTNSKMAMQGAAGSFNIGNGNLISNLKSGNSSSSVNDPDVVDIVSVKKFSPKFF